MHAQSHPFREKSKAIFRLRKPEVTHSTKKQSDISAPQTQGHPCHEKAKRYFDYACTRSPIPRKSKAIFRLRKNKVTHSTKKQSDIPAPQTQGHPFHKKAKRYFGYASPRSLMLRKGKAIFRLHMHKVTHSAKKAKRYSRSANTMSPIPQKSKAIFRLRKHELTHLEVWL